MTKQINIRRLRQPNITPIADREYRLEEEYVYYHDHHDGKNILPARLIVAQGFRYDGASVPRLAWSLSGILPDGLIRAAALIHDYIYEHKGKVPFGSLQIYVNGEWWYHQHTYTRAEADQIFYNMMVQAGMKKHKAWIAYKAVRSAGWTFWRQ